MDTSTTWTAYLNVIDGTITIKPNLVDELPMDGSFAINEIIVEGGPWEWDEQSLDRADTALTANRLVRVMDWIEEGDGYTTEVQQGMNLDEIAYQIADEVDSGVLFPLEAIAGSSEQISAIRTQMEGRAYLLATQLLSGDDKLAAQTAIDLVNLLFGPVAEIPNDWWSTPLGQAMAASVGHPLAEAVSYSVAGAMLGVSKTRIQQLVADGKLDRAPDGGITTVSIRQRLQP